MANTIRTSGFAALTQTLISARQKKNMSQRDLAHVLKCSQGTINRIETGQRRIDVVELIALSRVLGFDPHDALDVLMAEIKDNELIRNFSRP